MFVPAFVALLSLGALASIPPNLDDALSSQRSLAASNPGDARVLNDLANLLVLTGRLAEAEETYARAVTLAPDNAAIRYNHALALQQLDRHKRAIKEYKLVLELDPSQAWAHYQLGTLYAAAGKRERAVRSYARALELDPQLLSPEVNPHIIENRLVTPSLILARWGDNSTAMAPRLYQQPSRITDLLVPPLPVPEPEEIEDVEPAPSEESAETAGTGEDQALTEGDLTRVHRPAAQPQEPDESAGLERLGDPEPRAELGEDDDEADERDEAAYEDESSAAAEDREPATAGSAGSGGGSQVLTADDLVPSYVGQVQPRGRSSQGAPPGTSRTPTVPPGSSSTGPGGRPIRPPGATDPGAGTGTGTASTGRLELLLLPEPEDRLAGGALVDRPTG